MKIDIDRQDFYEFGKPELKERTKNRLTTLRDSGIVEVGTAEFGFNGITSGLFIEKVWSLEDGDFESYLSWMKNCKAKAKAKGKLKWFTECNILKLILIK